MTLLIRFSPGPPVSSTNKTDRHDITEILLKVALNTTKQTNIFGLILNASPLFLNGKLKNQLLQTSVLFMAQFRHISLYTIIIVTHRRKILKLSFS
jgi:hypothetical protein